MGKSEPKLAVKEESEGGGVIETGLLVWIEVWRVFQAEY